MAVSVYRLVAARLRKPGGSGFRSLERGAIAVHCIVMGLFEAWHCETVAVELAPGDTLLLYTDGITEARTPTGKSLASPASRLLLKRCDKQPSSLLSLAFGPLPNRDHLSGIRKCIRIVGRVPLFAVKALKILLNQQGGAALSVEGK